MKKILPLAILFLVSIIVLQIGLLPSDLNKFNMKWIGETNESFCFSVIGDVHNNFLTFNEITKEIKQTNSSFMIINGDFTHEGTISEYIQDQLLFRSTMVPFIVNIGNHDVRADGAETFERIFGPRYFSWGHGNSKFIFLDNAEDVSQKQLEWFVKELENDYENTFIIAHKPISSHNKHLMSYITSGKVTAVFQSHRHAFYNETFDNVSFYITQSAGGVPKPDAGYGFTYVCVDDEVKVEQHNVEIHSAKTNTLTSYAIIERDFLNKVRKPTNLGHVYYLFVSFLF